jgi:hypothetical protein
MGHALARSHGRADCVVGVVEDWRDMCPGQQLIMLAHVDGPRVVKDERWALIEGMEKSGDQPQ